MQFNLWVNLLIEIKLQVKFGMRETESIVIEFERLIPVLATEEHLPSVTLTLKFLWHGV